MNYQILPKNQAFSCDSCDFNISENSGPKKNANSIKRTSKSRFPTYRCFSYNFLKDNELLHQRPKLAVLLILLICSASKKGEIELTLRNFIKSFPQIAASQRTLLDRIRALETRGYLRAISSNTGIKLQILDFHKYLLKSGIRIYCADLRRLVRKSDIYTSEDARDFFCTLHKSHEDQIRIHQDRLSKYDTSYEVFLSSHKSAHKSAHHYIYSKGYCYKGFNDNKRKFKTESMATMTKEEVEVKKAQTRDKVFQNIQKSIDHWGNVVQSQAEHDKQNEINDVMRRLLRVRARTDAIYDTWFNKLNVCKYKSGKLLLMVDSSDPEEISIKINNFMIFHEKEVMRAINARCGTEIKYINYVGRENTILPISGEVSHAEYKIAQPIS